MERCRWKWGEERSKESYEVFQLTLEEKWNFLVGIVTIRAADYERKSFKDISQGVFLTKKLGDDVRTGKRKMGILSLS